MDDTHEGRWLDELQHDDPQVQGYAALRLASAARARGEFDRAQLLLRTVCHQGDAVVAPRAAFALGKLHDEIGNHHRAELAYQLAAQLSRPASTPDVHLNLGARWAAHGRTDEAVQAYTAVVEGIGAHVDDEWLREELAVAWFRLGDLLSEQGDPTGAERAFRSALASGDDEVAPRSALALARLLVGENRGGDVDSLLEHALSLDHPDCSPEAALWLAGRCSGRGDYRRAYQLLNIVVECEHPEYAEDAQRELDALLRTRFEVFLEDVLENHFRSPAWGDDRRDLAASLQIDGRLETAAQGWSAEAFPESIETSLRWLDPSDDARRHIRALRRLRTLAVHQPGNWDVDVITALSHREWDVDVIAASESLLLESKRYRRSWSSPSGANQHLMMLLALWSRTLGDRGRDNETRRCVSTWLDSSCGSYVEGSLAHRTHLLTTYRQAALLQARDDFDVDYCAAEFVAGGGEIAAGNLYAEVAASLARGNGRRAAYIARPSRGSPNVDVLPAFASDGAALVAVGALTGVALAGLLAKVMPALAELARALPEVWRRLSELREASMSSAVRRNLGGAIHTQADDLLRSLEALGLWANVHEHYAVGAADAGHRYGRELTLVGGTPTLVEMEDTVSFGSVAMEQEEDEDDEGTPHRMRRPVLLLR